MALWLDDNWEGSPVIRRAGLAAWGLYCACGLWIARHSTDGHVDREVVVAYGVGAKKLAKKLVEVGLWEQTERGYYAPDYLTLNPTSEKARHQRKLAAERAARYRRRQCP